MIRSTWEECKSFANRYGLTFEWVVVDEKYYIRAERGVFVVECIIPIKASASAEQLDFETNFKTSGALAPKAVVQLPFASKTVGTKKLYKRVHGISVDLAQGANIAEFTIPYAWAKMTAIEVIGGSAGDSVSLSVLDSASGMLSGVPNLVLNQFGFSVKVAPGFYEHTSAFDADLYGGLQLRIAYSSVDAKTIGVNFVLDEVK